MRLFEAIVRANERAVAGEPGAGFDLADFADSLPVVALTCIDPRLNRLLPGALGLPEEQFIWLRNAGNIITGPLSSTMRSLALACAVKGGREIVILGHTDCAVRKTSAASLIDACRNLGISREQLPADIVGYFGLFASERQNVIQGVDCVRNSPLIGPRAPVHGLLIDVDSGRLEWVVNGYQTLDQAATAPAAPAAEPAVLPARASLEGAEPAPTRVETAPLRIDAPLGQIHVVPPDIQPPSPPPPQPSASTPVRLEHPRRPLPPRILPKVRFFGKGRKPGR